MADEFKDDGTDLLGLRDRLRQMSDTDLRRFGRDALCLCRQSATGPKNRESAVIQLEEARAELKRRNDHRDSRTNKGLIRRFSNLIVRGLAVGIMQSHVCFKGPHSPDFSLFP